MFCNISQNAMGQAPRGGTLPGPAGGGEVPCWGRQWYPAGRGGTLPGVFDPGRVPPQPGQDGGGPCWVTPPPCRVHPPRPGQDWGGYPVRTTEGVLTTRRAVCLLRSHRRTFLFACSYIETRLQGSHFFPLMKFPDFSSIFFIFP